MHGWCSIDGDVKLLITFIVSRIVVSAWLVQY